MSQTETEQQRLLNQLSRRLRRPQASFAAFEALSADEIEVLMGLIATACEREQQQLRTDLRRALPAPLRALAARRWGLPL